MGEAVGDLHFQFGEEAGFAAEGAAGGAFEFLHEGLEFGLLASVT